MAQVTNYQCPACTGPLNFDPETGKVSCDFCGSSYELAEIEALHKQVRSRQLRLLPKPKKRRSCPGAARTGARMPTV